MTYGLCPFSPGKPIPAVGKEEEGVVIERSVRQADDGTWFSPGGGGPCSHNPAQLPCKLQRRNPTLGTEGISASYPATRE